MKFLASSLLLLASLPLFTACGNDSDSVLNGGVVLNGGRKKKEAPSKFPGTSPSTGEGLYGGRPVKGILTCTGSRDGRVYATDSFDAAKALTIIVYASGAGTPPVRFALTSRHSDYALGRYFVSPSGSLDLYSSNDVPAKAKFWDESSNKKGPVVLSCRD